MSVVMETPDDQSWLPHDHDWTVDDLELLPDDGLQYELVDGVLLVSPAPRPVHQRALLELAVLLREACPRSMETFVAPLDFQPTRRRSLQPDICVVKAEDVEEKNVTRPPVLVVEVLSPSTRSKDLLLKRVVYAESGVPAFWVVDPDLPALSVNELRDGQYVEVATVKADEPYDATAPFPVRVVPAALVERR
jgi:Uma2 family endonuclease